MQKSKTKKINFLPHIIISKNQLPNKFEAILIDWRAILRSWGRWNERLRMERLYFLRNGSVFWRKCTKNVRIGWWILRITRQGKMRGIQGSVNRQSIQTTDWPHKINKNPTALKSPNKSSTYSNKSKNNTTKYNPSSDKSPQITNPATSLQQGHN